MFEKIIPSKHLSGKTAGKEGNETKPGCGEEFKSSGKSNKVAGNSKRLRGNQKEVKGNLT